MRVCGGGGDGGGRGAMPGSPHHPLTSKLVTPVTNTALMEALVKPTCSHHTLIAHFVCKYKARCLGSRRREGEEVDDGTASVVSYHPRRDSAPTITIICSPV